MKRYRVDLPAPGNPEFVEAKRFAFTNGRLEFFNNNGTGGRYYGDGPFMVFACNQWARVTLVEQEANDAV